jgi:hypothetical protein
LHNVTSDFHRFTKAGQSQSGLGLSLLSSILAESSCGFDISSNNKVVRETYDLAL